MIQYIISYARGDDGDDVYVHLFARDDGDDVHARDDVNACIIELLAVIESVVHIQLVILPLLRL